MPDLTKCPKCGSARIALAHDEAPPWATKWTKCFACGKRWNIGGPPTPRSADAEESGDDTSAEAPPKRTGEDLVQLVMDLSRKQPAVPTKETTMAKGTTCTKGSCPDEAAEDSVRCPKHRDMQRASNEKFQGRAVSAVEKPKRKYTRRNPLGGGTAVVTLPTNRSNTPITLAEPTMVNGLPRRMDLDGNVLTVIDGLIQQREAELVLLRGTKEILERHG